MSRLCAQAQSILSSVTSPGHHHVYFIGGYCDIPRRIKCPLPNLFRHRRPAIYEEYIFVEPQDTAVQRMALTFRDTATVVKELGATPVFCTIPPSCLEVWNRTRLSQKKTSLLSHYLDYPIMQESLLATTIEINHHITQINHENSVHTPFLADTIVKKPGKDKKHRAHYSRLSDGVHPSNDTKIMWANKLMRAIVKNRPDRYYIADSDPESDEDAD